jgi:acyl-CoA reductase-like NAD-dependent aldehyde dehydrogenase
VENKIRALRPSKDVSSLISQQPIPRLEKLLAKAVSEGAKLIHGGKRFNHPDRPHGAYFTPTLVVDVTMDMDIAKEELFAPVMSVVGYETVDEAIGWLNASRFGLGASVFGNDKKECQGVASRLECGMVSINE